MKKVDWKSLVFMLIAVGWGQESDPCGDWDGGDLSPTVLQELADKGCPSAQTNLGLLYIKGQGVSRDAGIGAQWYLRAAQGGSATGQFNLALLYAQGMGVAQNWGEAARWMEAAAKQGHGPALPLAQVYRRTRIRMEALDSLLRGPLREVLALYQSSQPTGKDEQVVSRLRALLDSLEANPIRVQLGSWPTDGVEEKEVPQASGRMVKEYQVLVPFDCATDRFELAPGEWYQVQVVPQTRARVKVQDVQPGGALEVNGKLARVELDMRKNTGKDRCGMAIPSYTTVRLVVKF